MCFGCLLHSVQPLARRRIRELHETNTKTFVEERKRQAARQIKQLEKLKKQHEDQLRQLQLTFRVVLLSSSNNQ